MAMPLSKTRWAATPDTPTFDEAGVPGLHASFWHGLWAPRGTPKDVIATLHAEPQCDRSKATHRVSLPLAQSHSCAWEHWKRRLIVRQCQRFDKNPAATKSATLASETR